MRSQSPGLYVTSGGERPARAPTTRTTRSSQRYMPPPPLGFGLHGAVRPCPGIRLITEPPLVDDTTQVCTTLLFGCLAALFVTRVKQLPSSPVRELTCLFPRRLQAEDTWVNCDTCGKWRKVPLREKSSIDLNKSFQCSLLSNVSCSTPEEFWEDDGWEDEQDGNSSPLPKSKKRRQGEAAAAAPQSKARGGATLAVTLQRSCSPPRAGGGSSQSGGRLQRSGSPKRGSDKSMPLSPPGACPGSPTAAAGGPSMSRLEAVIRVLRSLKKVMHYEALTKQALRMGLIRFSGSQGTAGESMKAFLNKIIRENRSNSIVNLGKGIYGLKEWVVEGGVVVDAGEGGNGGDSKSSPLTQHSGILNWNDFQHRYGGRGHSREQLHDMYLTTCGGSVDPSPRGSGPGSFPPTPTESFAKSQAEAMSGITSPKCGGGVTGLAAILAGGFADGGLPPQQGNANGEDIKDRRMMVMDLIN